MTQSGLEVDLLGELTVRRRGEEIALPRSKKTRALLGLLLVTARPHRRDRLCEMFWDLPDDPRAALRWSLSKLRPVVNDPCRVRLQSDRERVALDTSDIVTDLSGIRALMEQPEPALEELQQAAQRLADPLLDGLDLPEQAVFENWLRAEREDVVALEVRVLARLATHPRQTPSGRLSAVRRWCEAAPLDPEAASLLIRTLREAGRAKEAKAAEREIRARFAEAGLAFEPDGDDTPEAPGPAARRLLRRQSIHFCTAGDGTRIAYATVGEGPPLVKAANWLNHLELDWDAPIWSPLFRELARDHRFIRYDERGNGLSDWDVEDISFEAFVTDLETVVDALGLDRFALLGISQGAAVSIEYAVRHPGRVSHLILFGGYPAGWRVEASAEEIAAREAVMTLTRTGWGQDNPAYRQIFSSTFMPSANAEELAWFNEFQRQTTSPDNAVRFLSAFGDIDVRHRLGEVRVPTLVLHSRGDQRIAFETGRDLAARIPGAEFVPLESDAHLLLGRDPASAEFIAAIREFLGDG
ncbi:alpha/beta fold hydrolase [Marinicauda algicola]|uniref:Alpha/beta fold hydrolase n=1 Tax=Marinicauda algicola TaxID=2029849 RepID=A0A4S2H308_9PROT|nr:alpha/beta fold hydrolase [Marinicauda algicola]TGY89934.1 alpha/beta fold hydrolase [Marinicauda algicola]